jgi:dethiobiotin synthetase
MRTAMNGLTILGTDTEVGKTYVACQILASLAQQGVRAAAYKPVASGVSILEESDAFLLWMASGKRGELARVSPQQFSAAVAPPIAARLDGNRMVDEKLLLDGSLAWEGSCDFLVVEGVGGLMSPISWSMTNATLASWLGFPIMLVTANRLGVVNQVLTALKAAQAMDLVVRWVVLNELGRDLSIDSNQELLESFLKQVPNSPKLIRLQQGGTEFDSPFESGAVVRVA